MRNGGPGISGAPALPAVARGLTPGAPSFYRAATAGGMVVPRVVTV